jgi:hypothetical protein
MNNHIKSNYSYDNFTWLPMPKNASTSFEYYFAENKWEASNDVKYKNNTVFFAFIQDPYNRHTAGIVEDLGMAGKISLLDDNYIRTILSTGVIGKHSMPLNFIQELEIIEKIIWIPIDLAYLHPKLEFSILLNQFFSENHLPFTFNNSYPRYNESWAFKKNCMSKVKEIKDNNKDLIRKVWHPIFLKEIEIYNKTVRTTLDKVKYEIDNFESINNIVTNNIIYKY